MPAENTTSIRFDTSAGRAVLFKALEQSPAAIALTDLDGHIVYANERFSQVTGYEPAEIIGQHSRTMKSGEQTRVFYQQLWDTILKGEQWSGNFHNRKKNGELYWERATISPIRNERGDIEFFVKIGEDITELKHLEEERDQLMKQLREKALRDPLTGLLNRRGFDQEYRRIWSMSLRHPFPVGLLIIDIDHFKTLNDSYGHPVGDQVLFESARLIQESVRESDIVCRYGGDEMIVILPWSDGEETRAVSERMVESFRQRELCRDTHRLRVTISVGAGSVIPGEDETADRFLAETDKALYRAKRTGRDRVGMIEQRIPQESAAEAAGADMSVRFADGREKISVLVVDDDEIFLAMIERYLSDQGYDFHAAETGMRAAESAAQHRGNMDVALVDLQLGDESGLDLIKKLREIDDSLITIIVTGQATIDSAIEALRLGAYDFVQKPIMPSQLMMTLERAIRYRRLLLENRRYQMHLENMVREKSMALTQALKQVRTSYQFTLEAMAAMLDAREQKTGDHSKRVALMSRVLAREMGLTPENIQTVETGALLHDIGKIAIPDAILLKPGSLTDEEREIMNRHVQLGYDMIRGIPELKEAAEIVYAHQEYYDGKGYPRGLKGEEICPGARIFAVADMYDAIRSDRPYSKGMSAQKAMEELHRQRGKQFDPDVVDAMIRCRDEIEKIGNWPEAV